MVDGGSLENCCTARYRGFESLILRKNATESINYGVLVPKRSQKDVFWDLF